MTRALLEEIERMRNTVRIGSPVEAETVTPFRELLVVGVDVVPAIDVETRYRVNDCGQLLSGEGDNASIGA